MRSRTENMAIKQYLKARFNHLDRKGQRGIKSKIRKQFNDASQDKRDKFVDDVRELLQKNNIVTVF